MDNSDGLKFGLECSQDRGKYPDFFNIEIGSDFHLNEKPNYYAVINNPREVIIEITSFRGSCAWAEHYYATIKADGIKICSKEIDAYKKEHVYHHGGYVCKEYSELPREKRDIWSIVYEINVVRHVSKEMLEENPDRWEGFEIGYPTTAFDTKKDAIAAAKKVIAARFSKEWKVRIDDLTK